MKKIAEFSRRFCRIPPFQYLDAGDLQTLLESTGAREMIVPRGNHILRASDYPGDILMLDSGTVESTLLLPSGKTLGVQRISAPDVIGAAVVFASRSGTEVDDSGDLLTFPGLSIHALTDTRLVGIEKRRFRQALSDHPELLDGFLEFQANRFLRISSRMQYLALGRMSQKVALYLLGLPRTETGAIQLPVSVTTLARHFAVERPSLAAVFGRLEADGYITRHGRGALTIDDLDGLEKLIVG